MSDVLRILPRRTGLLASGSGRASARRLASRLALALVLVWSTLALTGCFGMSDEAFLEMAAQRLLEYLEKQSGEADAGKAGPVKIALTYPVGKSPKVFVSGWVFGASAVAVDADGDEVDLSEQVKWSGSGSFSPDKGTSSHPTFNAPGANKIKLSVAYKGKTYSRTFKIQAVSTKNYARLGDKAQCPADSHGGLADPMPTIGPIISGSPLVLIDGRPAARKGDRGVHAACSGPNTFEIVEGDPNVLINGRPAAKLDHQTRHCGGMGRIVEASGG